MTEANNTPPQTKTEGMPPTPAEYVQDALENAGILYGPGAGRPLGILAQSTSKRDRQRLQSAFKKGVKEGRRLEREAHAAEIEKISTTLSAREAG